MQRGFTTHALLSFALLLLTLPTSILGHPNNACLVGCHPKQANPFNDGKTYSAAKSAGYNFTSVVIFDGSDSSLYGRVVVASDPVWYLDDDGGPNFWFMQPDFPALTFSIASNVVPAASSIAAYGTNFVVTYVSSSSPTTLKSKTINTNTNTASSTPVTVATISSTSYSSSFVAGSGGFFYTTIVNSTIQVFISSNAGSSWQTANAAALTVTPFVNGTLTSALDASGNLLIVYHSSSAGLAVATLASGSSSLVQKASSIPSFNAIQISVAPQPKIANFWFLVGNYFGNLTGIISRNGGQTWGEIQQIVNAKDSMAAVDTPVAVIRTDYVWDVLFLSPEKQDVLSLAIEALVPNATTWVDAQSAMESLVSTNSSNPSDVFSSFNFVVTGGLGWDLTVSTSQSDVVSFRPCYTGPNFLGSSGTNVMANSGLTVALGIVSLMMMMLSF